MRKLIRDLLFWAEGRSILRGKIERANLYRTLRHNI